MMTRLATLSVWATCLALACGDDGRPADDTTGLSVGSANTGMTGTTVDVPTGTTAEVPTTSAPTGETGSTTSVDPCPGACGDECCEADDVCLVASGQCIPDLGPCATNDDCQDDSYCDAGQSICAPYPDDGTTDLCETQREPGIFRVQVQCEWTAPPPGDPYPNGTEVRVKPLVADFNTDDDPATIRPSLVIVTSEGGSSVIRLLDGETCEQQFMLPEHLVTGDSTPAIGDLDGDGRPEVVAHHRDGGAVAWTWDPAAQAWAVMWRSMDLSATSVHSVSIADLDDDAVPEVILGAIVYGADGQLRSNTVGQGDKLCGIGYHAPATIADVDLDDRLEIVGGGTIWTWDDAANDLVEEPYFTAVAAPAFTAVADFGEFPGAEGDAPGRPEIVAMSPMALRVQTIAGALLFGPVALPGGGDGGNVTIADYDGDGAPEIGVVSLTLYIVYDPACGDPKFPGECASGSTDGILWQATVAENSCAIMGSTVFDFEGDDAAEVVYADECFIRVFSGKDGQVIWSHPRSSATWYEAPVVADVDGDARAELVTGYSPYVGSCGAVDPIFAGLRCTSEFACPTAALTCDADLCRCAADADCGDPDMVCVDPLPTSPGTGKVCRAAYSTRVGVRVFSDANWVGARPIWNQHAYSVTHVESDGTIPQGSAVPRNWQVPGLNNFRQNTQDELGVIQSPDITVEGVGYGKLCSAENPVLPLEAEVCNRGLLPLDPPVAASFYDADPAQGGALLCTAVTVGVLAPGACEVVTCDWLDPPTDTAIVVFIEVDGGGTVAECFEGNNSAGLPVQCPPPPPQ
jgi:hypothetical protein